METTVVSAVAAGVHQATAASGGAAAATSSTAASAAATPLFSPASSGPRVQVKEGIGPKLPRPNRVRVPTRRELASYGIKLPSQREAEQRARQAERDPHYDDELLSDEEADAMEQDELARQFAATQQQRYGHRWEDDNATDDDEADAAAEAELARQFAATQQQRYATEQPPGANPFSPADYEFSPMKTLVNDGPSEPLFTPTPEVQPQQPAQRYQQPAAAPQQGLSTCAASADTPTACAAAAAVLSDCVAARTAATTGCPAGASACRPCAAGEPDPPAADAQWR